MRVQKNTILWNLCTMFLIVWFALAGWLLLDGDGSATTRFAVAVSGCLGLYANSRGSLLDDGWFLTCRGFDWARRKRVYRWLIPLILLTFPLSYGLELARSAQDFYIESGIRVAIIREGLTILDAANNNNRTMPSDIHKVAIFGDRMGSAAVSQTFTPHGRPFIRRGELNGLRIAEISDPSRVIVLYSRALPRAEARTVYFLDGQTKVFRDPVRFSALLRDQDRLISNARRERARRESAETVSRAKVKP